MDTGASSSSSISYNYYYDDDPYCPIRNIFSAENQPTTTNNLSRFGDLYSIPEYHPQNHHNIRLENRVSLLSDNVALHEYMKRLEISDHVPNKHGYHHQKNRPRHTNNSNGYIYYTPLEKIRGQVATMAMEKEGSAYLQKRLEMNTGMSTEEFDMIFKEIEERVCELMVGRYGNYVIQEIYQRCTEDQINRIFHAVSQTQEIFVEICLDINGSRAIQKIVGCMKTQNQISKMVSVLNPIVILLATSANGYHVILNCVSLFPSAATESIVRQVTNNCVELAMDKFGCHVVGACIGNNRGEVLQQRMQNAIIEDAVILAEHPYGNYVIQNIVESGNENVCQRVFQQFENRLIRLSTNKYGSNVVEKCLYSWRPHLSNKMIINLMFAPTFASDLLMDEFGNYVAQSALEVAEGMILIALIKKIQSHHLALSHHRYGRKVLDKTNKGEFLFRKNLLVL